MVVLLDHDAVVLAVLHGQASEGGTSGPPLGDVANVDAVIAASHAGVGDQRYRVLHPDASGDGQSRAAHVGYLQIGNQAAGAAPVVQSPGNQAVGCYAVDNRSGVGAHGEPDAVAPRCGEAVHVLTTAVDD